MLFDALSEVLFTQVLRLRGNIDLSRDGVNDRTTSEKTRSSDVMRVGILALVLAAVCIVPDSIAQTAKGSIDVPPHSRLLLRAIGSGDQVYGCVNGGWLLKTPDAKLLDQDGSVIGRHCAGPTWQLNDGSWVKGKAVAKQVAPDATGVPWLLLASVDGSGRLRAVRFIQRTDTQGGNAPDGVCRQGATLRVPYKATYSFYEADH
jgi:hypothetical protein